MGFQQPEVNRIYLENKRQTKITAGNINRSVFACRFDGLFHGIIKAVAGTRCQFCYYQWKHEYDDTQREGNLFMEKNKTNVVRSLVCNVNLCPNCTNKWHGIDTHSTNRLLGQ